MYQGVYNINLDMDILCILQTTKYIIVKINSRKFICTWSFLHDNK